MSPDVVIYCNWDEASRYLFRSRPVSEGTPLEGVLVQIVCVDDTPKTWTSPFPPIPALNCPPLAGRFVGIHGAAVRSPSGGAITFVGDRGSGKSSLALDFVNQGDFELLTDETLLIHRRTTMVEPFPIAIGVFSADGPKVLVPATEAVRAIATRVASIERVIILKKEPGAQTSVVPLTQAEAVREITPHHLDVGADMSESIITLVRLFTRVRADIFRYSNYDALLTLRSMLEVGTSEELADPKFRRFYSGALGT